MPAGLGTMAARVAADLPRGPKLCRAVYWNEELENARASSTRPVLLPRTPCADRAAGILASAPSPALRVWCAAWFKPKVLTLIPIAAFVRLPHDRLPNPAAAKRRRRSSRIARVPAVVLTTDFGLRDGAVSAMKGVAIYGVDDLVPVSDLTHEIPPFDVWTRRRFVLQQTYRYWPAGTVFVTVVDPGVGSARRSLAVRTKTGHVFVGPDNGHLTRSSPTKPGVDVVRVIDETKLAPTGFGKLAHVPRPRRVRLRGRREARRRPR